MKIYMLYNFCFFPKQRKNVAILRTALWQFLNKTLTSSESEKPLA